MSKSLGSDESATWWLGFDGHQRTVGCDRHERALSQRLSYLRHTSRLASDVAHVRVHLGHALLTPASAQNDRKPCAPSSTMSTQPLLQRTAAKRIALPVRVEPKVSFANERTFLSWLHFTVVLGGLAVGLLNFGDKVCQASTMANHTLTGNVGWQNQRGHVLGGWLVQLLYRRPEAECAHGRVTACSNGCDGVRLVHIPLACSIHP